MIGQLNLLIFRHYSQRERLLALQELRVWLLLAIGAGTLNGGVVGVIMQNKFAGFADEWLIVVGMALATAAMPISNLSSFFWVNACRGKRKLPFLQKVLSMFALLTFVIALLPSNNIGAVALVILVISCQVCASCLITIRALIWRANYRHQQRATVAARTLTLYSVTMAFTGLAMGYLINHTGQAYRLVFIVASLCCLGAKQALTRLRLRHERKLVAEELASGQKSGIFSTKAWSILKTDSQYRNYQLCMFIFGSGNLMFTALLILVLSEQLGQGAFVQVLLSSTLPLLAVTLSAPWWAPRIASRHIVSFRARHSWLTTSGMFATLAGAISGEMLLVWLGTIVLGVALGGGRLGWNLGHNDFSSTQESSDYMGIHVTLTGVRGLIMPLLGVVFYQWLEFTYPGNGELALGLPLLLVMVGAIGFGVLNQRMGLTKTG